MKKIIILFILYLLLFTANLVFALLDFDNLQKVFTIASSIVGLVCIAAMWEWRWRNK